MKAMLLYRKNSEHDSLVNRYVADFRRQTGYDIDLVDLDTRDGADKARTYDVVRYPAIVAFKEDGAPVQVWQDEMLPTFSELSYYTDKQAPKTSD